MNFENLIAAFLADQDVMDGSKETYERNLRGFILWLQDNKISSPRHEDIVAYKKSLQRRELSPHSIANYLTAVKQFFTWAEAKGHHDDIASDIKSGSGSKKDRFCKDALSIEQVLQLLDSIDRSTDMGKRDFAMLNLMVRTGLRSIEVVRANLEDVQQKDNRHVLWVQGKGRLAKDEFIVLNPDSHDPLKLYLQTRLLTRGHSPLFVSGSRRNLDERLTTRSVRRIVKKYLREMDLDSPRLSCHSLRHTAVTLALKAGAPIRQAQRMARHASVQTTERYAHELEVLDSPAEDQIASLLETSKKVPR